MFLRAALLLGAIVLNLIPRHTIAFHLPLLPLRHPYNNNAFTFESSQLIKSSESVSTTRGGFATTTTEPSSSTTSTLFPCATTTSRLQKNRSLHLPTTQLFVALSTEENNNPTRNKALLRRLYDNSIGRLWKVFLFLFKLLLLKPLSMIKSLVTSKEKNDSDSEEVIKIENKAPKPITIEQPLTNDLHPAPQKYVEVTNQDQNEKTATTGQQLVVERPPILIEEQQNVGERANIQTKVPYFLEEREQHGHSKDVVSHKETSNIRSTESLPIIESTHKGSVSSKVKGTSLPKGERWAIAAPGVDLTAKWKIIVDNDFKEKYDAYLKGLGQPSLVRSVAVSIVEMTTEEIIQGDEGRELCIKGKNLRGLWERTLVASGSDYDEHHQDRLGHLKVPIVTADKEKVVAEAWWEDHGKIHFSTLKGVKKYGGGDFESKRYLENDGNVLVCESAFVPNGEGKEKVAITWKFKRT